MSFNEVIAELPRLTLEDRQILIRRALELDDLPLSAADEELVEARWRRTIPIRIHRCRWIR